MLVIWDLESGNEIQSISCVFHGPVSAATWVSRPQVIEKSFVFGCADGTLHVYRRPGEVGQQF
jgi:WD40 repeat protein